MALDPATSRRSISPESSGRASPLPRQWRNQLGGSEDTPPENDKHHRKYAAAVERALSLFETTLQEWADYISFLNRLLKALQSRHSSISTIPSKAVVAKRLAQCLNPSLPSGVHQKSLEVYNYIFSVIGQDGLSRDLPLYFPGLAPTLSFASLTVRAPYLDLLETHFLGLHPVALRPAMKSIVLALLPGLEDETSDEFDRTMKLLESFKMAIRPPGSELIAESHSTGDHFFWQCFFLASITGQSRRLGALAYLVRKLPKLAHGSREANKETNGEGSTSLSDIVTLPEPGLLIRCFAAGLADDQVLIQRGYLDLLVSHLPLHCKVLQTKVKPADLELLLRAAVGVVNRRDMSLNRRLWSWLLGADSGVEQSTSRSKTNYFEEYGLQSLTQALLGMINTSRKQSPSERARPYRICLSLMDRWEIGGLVVPEVFLPIVDSVRSYKSQAESKGDFLELLRSASVFFDGVESGLIYGEMMGLLAQAVGPGPGIITSASRMDKLGLVKFIISNFNLGEEEMVTVHAPLTALSILCMLANAKERQGANMPVSGSQFSDLSESALSIAASLLDLVPGRAFPRSPSGQSPRQIDPPTLASMSNTDILKEIRDFYVNEQGNVEAGAVPFGRIEVGELLIKRACTFSCDALVQPESCHDLGMRMRILALLLTKMPAEYKLDVRLLLSSLRSGLAKATPLQFTAFTSMLGLSTHLYWAERISTADLSDLVVPLVRHGWAYLSASDPKYHVETVRCLWQLQTALTPQNREIEGAISGLMKEGDVSGTFASRPSEPGRSFSILWTHTLQDSPSHTERRGSKTPVTENKFFSMPAPGLRLAGLDHFDVMLSRPLFHMLDALLDERSQLFMTAKAWLNSMIGIDRLFLIFIIKFAGLSFLRFGGGSTENADSKRREVTDDDDLDLCLYYLRTLSNVLRWAPEKVWSVLAVTTAPGESERTDISALMGSEKDVAMQDMFLEVCMRCIALKTDPNNKAMVTRVTQLSRSALTVLHQILLNPFAEPLSSLNLEEILIDRLSQSLNGTDPYIQVLLLDVVYAAIKLHDVPPIALPTSPTSEKRPAGLDGSKKNPRLSISTDSGPQFASPAPGPPPRALLKCLRDGLSSPSSRPVLDSWIGFLTECLGLYHESIFQVVIPLVETLCGQVGANFSALQAMFGNDQGSTRSDCNGPESTLISLLNGLEEVLASAHACLVEEETKMQQLKSPDQPQSFLGSMVSGVFASDAPQSRSATANDRLTVHLAFQDAVRICYTIWHWGQGGEANRLDGSSAASFNYTSLRMRNRARRLLEHLFAAEMLECLETTVDIWRTTAQATVEDGKAELVEESVQVFNLLAALEGSRPKNTMPAIFNAIYSRTNPSALHPARKSTLTIDLADTDLVMFLVDYARSLDDDAMDEIWTDCVTFMRDLLSNPMPHRQTLPGLLEFAAILGEKVDNTNFGEQRKMRRELGDLFLRLLTAVFTTRPMTFADVSPPQASPEAPAPASGVAEKSTPRTPASRADDVVGILASIVPNLPKVLVEQDRVLSAAATISTSVIGPAFRAKGFPDTASESTLRLLHELSRLPGNQKTWRRDVGDAFNDARFFGSAIGRVKDDWMPLLRQWLVSDKDRLAEIVARISPPTTAGIVFGVGATSARLEADRKTQLNLRRIATLILSSADDGLVSELPSISDKLAELLGATCTSSPSSATRADVYMVVRALVLKTSAIHLAMLWPVINAELHAAISSVVAPDHSTASDTYTNPSILQACKLLDLLICVAPDDFQLHEWLFVTDTIEAIYRSENYQPVALVDELSEELGSASVVSALQTESAAQMAMSSIYKRPLLGPGLGGISDDVGLERRDELVAKVLRPFFGQLSIFAFESTYAMAPLDKDLCVQGLLKDLFNERSITKVP